MENLEIKEICSLHIYTTQKQRWTAKAPRNGCYFSYQRSGFYKHILSNKELIAKPGTVLFLNNNDSFNVIGKACGDAICAVLEIANPPESFAFDTGNDKTFSKHFNSLLLHADTSIASNYYIVLGILYELFGNIFEKMNQKNLSCKSQKVVENIYSYIHKNYENPELNMNELSSVSNTEIHKLNNMFRERYGLPCWQYVISVRIDTARNLLKATDYSISNIANLCGFSDPYYFSRAFKKATGKTPSEFRETKINVIKD